MPIAQGDFAKVRSNVNLRVQVLDVWPVSEFIVLQP